MGERRGGIYKLLSRRTLYRYDAKGERKTTIEELRGVIGLHTVAGLKKKMLFFFEVKCSILEFVRLTAFGTYETLRKLYIRKAKEEKSKRRGGKKSLSTLHR